MTGPEYQIHCAVIEYLLLQYPDVLFRSDLGGMRLPIGLAMKAKKVNGGRRAWPDLFIASVKDHYSGLFIEIKTGRDQVFRGNGSYRQSQHVLEQLKVLRDLSEAGYMAEFGLGFDDCKKKIDWYLDKIWYVEDD